MEVFVKIPHNGFLNIFENIYFLRTFIFRRIGWMIEIISILGLKQKSKKDDFDEGAANTSSI